MATFLDLGVFSNFRIIFTFLLVYVIAYGTMEWGKPFGKLDGGAKGLHALLSLAIAIVAVTYSPIVRLINFSVPWFFMIALVAFFIIFAIKLFSGSELDLKDAITKDTRVYTWIIVLVIVVLIFGLGNAFGQDSLENGSWDTSPTGGDGGSTGSGTVVGGSTATPITNTGVNGSAVATNDFGTNVLNTIFHPSVLALILIMLIGVFAIFFITD